MELQRVRYDGAPHTHTHTHTHTRAHHLAEDIRRRPQQKRPPRASLFASTITPLEGGPATLQLGDTGALWKLEIKGKRGGW